MLAFYEASINRKDCDAASNFIGNRYLQHNPLVADGLEGFRAFLDATIPNRVTFRDTCSSVSETATSKLAATQSNANKRTGTRSCLVDGETLDREIVMRVFVAGATGAIGKQLVPRLVAAGHEVHGMTRSVSKKAMLYALGAVPVVADALDSDQVSEAVGTASPDVVVHQLTAIGAIDTRHMERDFAPTNRLRTEGTDHLLAAAKAAGVRRIVAQSHIAPYARTGTTPKTEEDPFDSAPVNGMRQNQSAMEYLEKAVLGAGWAEGIVLRYGWLYGPGTSMAPGAETFEMIRKRKFPLVGDGGGVWSFIHIADAANATVAAIEHGNPGVYNVVDDDPAPVAEWLPALAQQLGAKKPLRVPRFVGRLFAAEAGVVMMTELRGASNAKAKRALAWRPAHPSWRHSLAAGV